jgi:hypothetical protein
MARRRRFERSKGYGMCNCQEAGRQLRFRQNAQAQPHLARAWGVMY